MVDVLTGMTIAAPRAVVAAFAADPDNVTAWYANIRSVEWVSPKPLTIGTRLRFVAHFLGRELRYTYEISEFVPGQRLTMRTADGPFPMETTYEWSDAPDGATRMTLRNRGTPSGFAVWTAPLMQFMMRRENRKDLARLKARLER